MKGRLVNSQSRKLTPTEDRCAQFLCDLTDFGRTYTVLDAAPGMKGVPMIEYTVGQLFDRLADHGKQCPCPDRERLLKEAQELLAPFVREGFAIDEQTVLGRALAAP
jgi:hypothetical protein